MRTIHRKGKVFSDSVKILLVSIRMDWRGKQLKGVARTGEQYKGK